jgi:hypothetical protein
VSVVRATEKWYASKASIAFLATFFWASVPALAHGVTHAGGGSQGLMGVEKT